MKEFKLKTLEDVVNAVNTENVENFLVDFSAWLRLTVMVDATDGVEQPNRGTLNWIDNGKNNVDIKVQVTPHP